MIQLHKLGLHEKTQEAGLEIMRVPGGWIYRFFELHQGSGGNGQWSENYVADSVFVPFSSEFNVNAESKT